MLIGPMFALMIVTSLLCCTSSSSVLTYHRGHDQIPDKDMFVFSCVNTESNKRHTSGCSGMPILLPHKNLSDITSLHVDLSRCLHLCSLGPEMFRNVSKRLRTLWITGPVNTAVSVSPSLFVGLACLSHLRLDNFYALTNTVPTSLLKPLTGLNELELRKFAKHNITIDLLSRLIGGLRQLNTLSLLDSLPLNQTRLNFNSVFAHCRHLKIKRLAIEGVHTIAGRLSTALPFLEHINAELYQDMFPGSVWASIDVTLLHPSVETVSGSFAFGAGPSPNMKPGKCLLPFNSCVNTNNESSDIIRDLIAASKTTDDPDCFQGVLLPVSPNLRSAISLYMRTNWLSEDSRNYCFDPSNVVETLVYKKVTNREPVLNWKVKGFQRLKRLYIENVQLDYVNPNILYALPNLTELYFISSTSSSFDFTGVSNTESATAKSQVFRHNPLLKTIDFSRNHITSLPSTLFRNLSNLEIINLTGNMIAEVDLVFSTSGKLRELSLRDGLVERISSKMSLHLDTVFGANIAVDLRNTSLLCDCSAIEFVSWMQRTMVTFIDKHNYSCMTPSGDLATLVDVDVAELRNKCAVVERFSNASDCPCDKTEFDRLFALKRSISDLWCNSNGILLPLSSLDKDVVNAACKNLKSGLMVSWLATALTLTFLVVGLVILITAFRRRRLVCIRSDLRALMRTLSHIIIHAFVNGYRESESLYDLDVFLFYHDNDGEWASRVLTAGVKNRLRKTVVTPDLFLGGGFWLDPICECLSRSRHVILVLSRDFAQCTRCQLVSAKVLSEFPHRVVAVERRDSLSTNCDLSKARGVFRANGDMCGIIAWPGDDSDTWAKKQFWSRLGDCVRSDRAGVNQRFAVSLSRRQPWRRRNRGASMPDLQLLA